MVMSLRVEQFMAIADLRVCRILDLEPRRAAPIRMIRARGALREDAFKIPLTSGGIQVAPAPRRFPTIGGVSYNGECDFD